MIDEDGCYDPADFNDGLLLGLKGTWLRPNYISARAPPGRQAQQSEEGELRFPFRSGFAMTSKAGSSLTRTKKCGRRGPGVSSVSRNGHRLRSDATIRGKRLRFPKRSYGGAWDGKIIWGRLTHGRVLGMLKNPSYAGMYVFGRYRIAARSAQRARFINGCTRWLWRIGASA